MMWQVQENQDGLAIVDKDGKIIAAIPGDDRASNPGAYRPPGYANNPFTSVDPLEALTGPVCRMQWKK